MAPCTPIMLNKGTKLRERDLYCFLYKNVHQMEIRRVGGRCLYWNKVGSANSLSTLCHAGLAQSPR